MNEAACPNCYWPADKPYPPVSDASAASAAGGSAPATPGGAFASGGSAPATPGGASASGGSAPATPGGASAAGGSAPATPGGASASGGSAPATPGGASASGGSAPATPGGASASGGSAPATPGTAGGASVVPPEIPEVPVTSSGSAGSASRAAVGSGGGSVEQEIPSFDLPEQDGAQTPPAAPAGKGRRLWLWIVLAVLLGAMLAAGGWYVWTQWSDYDRRTEDARRELSRDEVDEYDSSVDLNTLNNSSSGSLFGGDASYNDSTAEIVDSVVPDTVAYDDFAADSLAIG